MTEYTEIQGCLKPEDCTASAATNNKCDWENCPNCMSAEELENFGNNDAQNNDAVFVAFVNNGTEQNPDIQFYQSYDEEEKFANFTDKEKEARMFDSEEEAIAYGKAIGFKFEARRRS